MRKFLLLIITLCLHIAARGQTVPETVDLSWLPQPTQAKALRYWIDDDIGSMQTSDILNGRSKVDVSSLIEGLHTIHFQIIDSEEKVAAPYSGIFLKMDSHLSSSEASTLRYWFDDDTNISTCNANVGTQLLDATALLDGLHTLHYQVVDTEGKVSYVASGIFLKMQSSLDASSEASTLRYWFDDDTNVSTCNANVGTQLLDASTLLDGLHTLHYQVVDTDGLASYLASSIFLKMGTMVEAGEVKAEKLIYWFDDEETQTTIDMLSGTMMLDATNLLDGLHTIHYMVVCNDGSVTSAYSSIFLRMDIDFQSTTAQSLRYWFDDETNDNVTEIAQGAQMLDASYLLDGLHTVHYQVVDNSGSVTSPYSSIFLKMAEREETVTTAQSLRYWFDDETIVTTKEVSQGAQMLDASYLLDGLHTVHYQVVDNSGSVTSPYSSIFLKMAERDETVATAQSLRYWFNDDKEVKNTSVAGGTQIIDVTYLQAGLHTLHYQLVDSNGDVSAPTSRIFIKNFDKVLAEGENRITKYQYWLNMNSQNMQTVELSSATNPYTLISLLPMQKEPLQSSQFHFEVTNDVPTIYAKNTLHVRFYDAQNYFTDGQKQFVDYSVKQEVEPVGKLESTQTFDRVEENDIRWYTMQVALGDTAAFRVSQPATVQVFAPSGKEVFKTSESASIQWAGIHTWEEGTYYVAVHDVTGSRNTMTLDYMHMDKYAVVDWDVHTVGNGGCSTITFKGNGFRDLYRVDLYTAAGDSIRSVDVGHESDAETAVTFDFSGAELGKYDAVFHFTEEDVIVQNAIVVEEAIDIDLATDVSFPRTFSRSATYTVKITNKGNMTAYAVPIYTWIKSLTKDGIYKITYEGLDLERFMDSFNTDSLASSDILTLQAYSDQLSEDHYFMHFWVKDDNNPSDSIYVRSNYFFTNIAPSETKTIRLTIWTREVDTYAYFTVPEEWHTYSLEENTTSVKAKARFAKSKAGEWYCCYRERIECVANIVVNGLDIASLFSVPGPTAQNIAACVAGTVNQILTAAGDTYCGTNDVQGDFMKKVNNVVKGISIAGVVSSCASAFGVKNASEIGVALDNLLHPSTAVNCIQAFFKPIPGCPPDPPGGGGANGGKSHDPNDIHGYLSDVGSKFITDSVERVNYTIEFENDTAFATLAAHTIVIKDTLDSRYFDLRSFLPTSLKLGGREAFLDEADIKSENGVTSFVKTIDVRPEINAIAQVEGTYSQTTGIAEWRFTSLDPMTMEPTDDLMQGILPVNYDGTSGIGEVMFEIGVKPNKGDGTQIPNRAGIVFDYEDVIMTPTWTNTVDAVAPTSSILGGIQRTDSTLTLRLAGEDERSGVWKYNVYAQMGDGASWELVAENVQSTVPEGDDGEEGETETLVDVRIYDGIEYGFLVLATDSAGNVERKSFEEADFQLTTVTPGDANGDGTVDALDVVLVTSYYLGNDVYLNLAAADVNADGEVNSLDVVAIQNIYLNATNGKVLAPRRRKTKHELLK